MRERLEQFCQLVLCFWGRQRTGWTRFKQVMSMIRAIDPKVIIISTTDDIHAYAVSQTLTSRFACPNVILDLSKYPNERKMTSRINDGVITSSFSDPFHFALNSEQTVWWRRPEPFSADDNVWEPKLRAFIRRECQTTLLGMLYSSRCRIINSLQAEERASHKLLQLDVARACGFQIPRTLVTNDPAEVLAFIDQVGRQVVYKPQTDAQYHMAETRLLDAAAREKLLSVSLAPVMFQEFVPASFDIRLTVVGSRMFARRILSQRDKPRIDWRLDLLVQIEQMGVPESIAEPTYRLMAQLGLDYGAFDLRVTPTGEIYFFEVNPSGQFLFCELGDELEITEALCAVLIGKQSD